MDFSLTFFTINIDSFINYFIFSICLIICHINCYMIVNIYTYISITIILLLLTIPYSTVLWIYIYNTYTIYILSFLLYNTVMENTKENIVLQQAKFMSELCELSLLIQKSYKKIALNNFFFKCHMNLIRYRQLLPSHCFIILCEVPISSLLIIPYS